MKATKINSFPPKSNPFHHDTFNMGTQIAANITIMHRSHTSEKAEYLIIVNTDTGERLRIDIETAE